MAISKVTRWLDSKGTHYESEGAAIKAELGLLLSEALKDGTDIAKVSTLILEKAEEFALLLNKWASPQQTTARANHGSPLARLEEVAIQAQANNRGKFR